MDELDFELLHAKVLGAESRREMLQGRTGLPPVGWSPARASARMLGDHAAMPGSSAGTAAGHDRFGQCNGRLAFVLDRLEARVLRAGPAPKKGAKQPTPTLHLYDLEEPVELPEEPEPSDGPSVPFRLTEAKLGHEQIGDQPYFGRLNTKVTSVATTTVALFF
eukprot:s326_g11.t1